MLLAALMQCCGKLVSRRGLLLDQTCVDCARSQVCMLGPLYLCSRAFSSMAW